MLISRLFIVLAIVVILHGSLIVFWPPGGNWPQTVRWYRRSRHLSWVILVGAFVLAIAIPIGDGVLAGHPLAALVRDAVRDHPFVSGTILISLVLSVILALLEQIWINPIQRSSTRPGGVFYAWFIVTFAVSLAIGASGNRLLPTQDSTPEPIEARIPQTESLMGTLTACVADTDKRLSEMTAEHNTKQEEATNAPEPETKAKQAIAHEAARALEVAQQESAAAKTDLSAVVMGRDLLRDAQVQLVNAKSLTSKRGDEFLERRLALRKWDSTVSAAFHEFQALKVSSKSTKEWFNGAVEDLRHARDRVTTAAAGSQLIDTVAIVALGGLYALWTLSLLYRRIIEGDRLVGGTARTLAFNPLGGLQYPAQCVVVGPRHSGKTELLKSIHDCTYPPTDRIQTIEPVEARLARHIDYDVSVVDCGGEFIGDQLDLLTNLRTDCLLVVLCAAHLKKEDSPLKTKHTWNISRVHALVDENYDFTPSGGTEPEPRKSMDRGAPTIGMSCIAFFQAIYYATNRSGGHSEKRPRSHPSAQDLVAQVSRVIVVLNHRDKGTADETAYSMVPVSCLEELALSIYRRFLRHGQKPEHGVTAAIKVRLTPRNNRLHAVPEEHSSALNDNDGNFVGWARAFAGDWPDKPLSPPISTPRPTANALPVENVVSPITTGVRP